MQKRRKAKRLRRRGRSPTQRGAEGQPSALTARAVKGRTAALDDPADRCAAPARFSLAVVDVEAFGEIAELAVRADKIAQGRAAGSDRLGEHVADRRDKALQPLK